MSMKRRVLCVFSLIAYLLCACTILSRKIEGEMMVEVQSETRNTKESGSSTAVNISAVFSDGEENHLYQIVDGTGWETGLRVRELPRSQWALGNAGSRLYADISGGEDYRLILSASRQPTEGEKVRIVDAFETVADQYLAVYPNGVPEPPELPLHLTEIGRSETALLLECPDGKLPFLPQTVKTSSATTDMAQRIFSLTEAERFLAALPSVAAVVPTMIFGLLLWGFSCCLSVHAEKYKGLLWLNAALAAGSLGVLAYLLGQFDLPASLLPADNIFQWQYYCEEFNTLLRALRSMGMENHPLFSQQETMTANAMAVIRKGILAPVPVILAEGLAVWLLNRKGQREKT